MKKIIRFIRFKDERGVYLVLVALLLIPLVGIGALVVDLGLLYAARGELQNASDAGALAGARVLYSEDGTVVTNTQAVIDATDAAIANFSHGSAVEVGENDVQIGHWSFGLGSLARGFHPSNSTTPPDLWGHSTVDLDEDINFINAVQVTARRQNTPVGAFFSRIFNFSDFEVEATAVGYIGFAGTLAPGDVDAPIAICSQSLTGDTSGDECEPGYNCNIGYMLSDGQDKNTAAWTNFSQPCKTANTDSLRDLLTCKEANPNEITLGDSIGATNGVVDSVINQPKHESLVDCWKKAFYDSNGDGEKDSSIDRDGDGWPDMPWNMVLPVVNCPNLQVSNCMETCGAVSVNLVWILEKENKIDDDAPYKMDDWNMESEPDGITRWNSFVTHFNLKTPNGVLATVENDGFKKKSIYFLPDCTPHELKGNTGGHNYGVLARIPVIVN